LISRRKGTKFPKANAGGAIGAGGQADHRTGSGVHEIVFARGTVIPIFGQVALFPAPKFGVNY
jgi:hypothetical protein